MPLHVALNEFLETGFLGPIELGMQKPEIEDLLGPPDAEGGTSRKQTEPLVWKYGSFELHFSEETGEVDRIFSDDLEPISGGPKLSVDSWGLSSQSTRAQVERKLTESGVAFARTLFPWEERAGELVTCGLVSLLFIAREGPGAEDPADGLLTALSSTSSVVVAEAFDRQDLMRRVEDWRAAYPAIAALVPENGWLLDAYREDDGRTLYRMRAEFAPEPEPPSHPHAHD